MVSWESRILSTSYSGTLSMMSGGGGIGFGWSVVSLFAGCNFES